MPMKTTQTAAMSTHRVDLESSGDSQNGSDFGFTDDDDEDDYYTETMFDDEDDEDEFSGSGDGGRSLRVLLEHVKPACFLSYSVFIL